THARETMGDLENGELNLVEGSHVTAFAHSTFEKCTYRTFLQFLLSRKPNTPEIVALVEHFDSIKIVFGTNASLPHYAADGFLAAAHPLQVNFLARGQGTLQKQTATVTADIRRLHNVGEVLTREISTRDPHAD
ncbi:MAG: hypothetical protein WCC88_03810, partial [Candidatus Sulfotelmatobacter sp.]